MEEQFKIINYQSYLFVICVCLFAKHYLNIQRIYIIQTNIMSEASVCGCNLPESSSYIHGDRQRNIYVKFALVCFILYWSLRSWRCGYAFVAYLSINIQSDTRRKDAKVQRKVYSWKSDSKLLMTNIFCL